MTNTDFEAGREYQRLYFSLFNQVGEFHGERKMESSQKVLDLIVSQIKGDYEQYASFCERYSVNDKESESLKLLCEEILSSN